MEDLLENLIKKQKEYEEKIDIFINNTRSKYYKPDLNKIKSEKIKITSKDDMFLEMYHNKKYLNYDNMYNINISYSISDDIIKDIKHILSQLCINFLNDDQFIVSKNKVHNYFKHNDKIMIYNALEKNIFSQLDFRKQIWKIEEEFGELSKYYKKEITIQFHEEEDYNLIWMVVMI